MSETAQAQPIDRSDERSRVLAEIRRMIQTLRQDPRFQKEIVEKLEMLERISERDLRMLVR